MLLSYYKNVDITGTGTNVSRTPSQEFSKQRKHDVEQKMFLLLRGMLIPKFLNVILQRELETEEKRDILGWCGGGGVGAESSPVARTITAHFPTEGQ